MISKEGETFKRMHPCLVQWLCTFGEIKKIVFAQNFKHFGLSFSRLMVFDCPNLLLTLV